MRKRIPLFFVVCALMGAQVVSAATVLVFGDSLSAAYGLRSEQGWVHLLAEEQPQHRFINASISGETTGNGLARLPALLAEHRPDVLVLELGANDGLRGLPLQTMKENLDAMITLGKQANCRILLLGVEIPPNYGPRYTREFAALFPALAAAHGIAVVPFFLQTIAADPVHFQPDHLHPTAQAQPAILDTVRPAILPLLAP